MEPRLDAIQPPYNLFEREIEADVLPQEDYPMLFPFPMMLFVIALFTDVTYWRTADPLWSTMSSWLLLAGLIVAAFALLAQLIRLPGDAEPRAIRVARMRLLGESVAVLLSVVNFVFHVRDGYSAVVPAGPLLSAAVALILSFTGWMGLAPVRRHKAALAQGGAAGCKEA